jgi:hypothetical protein
MRLSPPIPYAPEGAQRVNELLSKLGIETPNSRDTFAQTISASGQLPQFVTFAGQFDPEWTLPLTVLANSENPVGVAMPIDGQTLQNPELLAKSTHGLFRQLGANEKVLEHASDLAAAAGEALKPHLPASDALINTPVAGIALVNAGFGLQRAYARGDRFEVGHYLLDGSANALDLGADLSDLVAEALAHTANAAGSPSLHGFALIFRVAKTAYLMVGDLSKSEAKRKDDSRR